MRKLFTRRMPWIVTLLVVLISYVQPFLVVRSASLADEEIPTYEQFLAGLILDRYMYSFLMSDESKMPYEIIVGLLSEDELFMDNVVAWKFATSQVHELSFDPYYQSVVHDILVQNFDELKIASTVEKIVKAPQASLNKNVVRGIQTILDLTEDDYITAPIPDMTVDQAYAIAKNITAIEDMKFIFSSVSKCAEYIGYCKNIEDIINKVAKAHAIQVAYADSGYMFRAMADVTDDAQFKTVLLQTANICDGTLDDEILREIFIADAATDILVSKTEDYIWDGVCAILGPFGEGLKIGQSIGKFATNMLFSTNDVIETYYEMLVLCDYQDTIKPVVRQYEMNYRNDKSDENAVKFSTSYMNMINTMIQGCAYTEKYVDLCYSKGIINDLLGSYKNNDYISFRNSNKNIQNTLKSEVVFFSYAESYELYMLDYFSDLLTDYPDIYAFETAVSDNTADESYHSLLDDLTQVGEYDPLNYLKYTISNDAVSIDGFMKDPRYLTIPAMIEDLPVTTISSYAFDGCKSLVSVKIPDTLTSIGSGAFRGCTKLDSIVLPDPVATIGNYAFINCASLASVKLPSTLTSIGDDAFKGCTKLNSIILPDSIETLGKTIFSNCKSLKSINCPKNLRKLSYYSYTRMGIIGPFEESFIEEIVFPSGIESIPASTFRDMKQLKSVDWPETVVKIETDMFNGCSLLTEIQIPSTVTGIGQSAFQYCASLSQIDISRTQLTTIVADTFKGCRNLVNVQLPEESLKSIGARAFAYCFSLETISLPDNITFLGECVFSNCDQLKEITIPTMLSKTDGPFSGSSVDMINLPEGITMLPAKLFSGMDHLLRICLPDSIVSIGDNAFFGCINLEEVLMPNSLQSIGNEAFLQCKSLTNIDLPDGVRSIGDNAFQGCSKLEGIILPDGIENLGSCLFFGCSLLKEINLPSNLQTSGVYSKSYGRNLGPFEKSAIERVGISPDMTNIPKGTFAGMTMLTRFVWPSQVPVIDEYMFAGCSGLEYIDIGDAQSVKYHAFANCTALSKFDISDSSLKYIGSEAFINCINLEDVILPWYTFTTLSAGSFANCTQLRNIYVPDSVDSIGSAIFRNCPALETVYVDYGDSYIASYVYDNYPEVNVVYTVREHRLLTLENADFVIPYLTELVEDEAFEGIPVTIVMLHSNITQIGDRAFADCKFLEQILIPSSVINISDTAFDGCPENLIIFCNEGSYADRYARDHRLHIIYNTENPL